MLFQLVWLPLCYHILPILNWDRPFAAARFQQNGLPFFFLVCLFTTDLVLGLSWINLFVYGLLPLSLICVEKGGFPSLRV